MGFQRFQLAVHRNAHRARRPFDHRLRRMVVGAVQAGELFEPGMEDLLGAGQVIATRLTFRTDGKARYRTRICLQRLRRHASPH